MSVKSNVHPEHVFENESCEHLAANGWSVRTHLQDAKSYRHARMFAIMQGMLAQMVFDGFRRAAAQPKVV